MTQFHVSAPLSAFGRNAAAAAGHPLATWTAIEILGRGGSGVDAAIAADALMGVVEPMATGIGGDVLAVVVEPDGAATTYNGTGRSPAGLTRDSLAAAGLDRIPERSPWSVTVPGAVAGWFDLWRRWGRLPIAEVLAPAIGLARNGFPIGPIVAGEFRKFHAVIASHEESRRLYRADDLPRPGAIFANPDLARTLERIAEDGPDAFYRGIPAQAAAGEIRRLGGLLSLEDFRAHRGFFAEPLTRAFHGIEVLECPPNTQGAVVLEALGLIEGEPLIADDPATTVAMVRAVEASFERIRETIADPGNTVATVVADQDGRTVTLMSSVFKRFGSGITVPGHGFTLQNRAFGFADFGHVNEPGPGKRPLHTVIPGAVRKAGKPWGAIGLVGGDMQPQGQFQVLTYLALHGRDPQAALDRPRWRWAGKGKVAVEAGLPEPHRRALVEAGFAISATTEDFGGGQVLIRVEDGWAAGSDRRKDGIALAF